MRKSELALSFIHYALPLAAILVGDVKTAQQVATPPQRLTGARVVYVVDSYSISAPTQRGRRCFAYSKGSFVLTGVCKGDG